MPSVELDDRTYDRVRAIAAVLAMSECRAISHLIDQLESRNQQGPPTPPPASMPGGGEFQDLLTGDSGPHRHVDVHMEYKGHVVRGRYDRATQRIVIDSEPLSGATFDRPSPAARAVVESIDTGVTSNRNGWRTWIVSGTGELLQSIRYRPI